MKHLSVFIFILLSPSFGYAALLKYEVQFESIDTFFTSDSDQYGVKPVGTGHLIADTELNAVVSGELVSDYFHFVWTSPPAYLFTYGHTLHGFQVVHGGNSKGTDVVSGVVGDISLDFLLPPNLINYSEVLDQHFGDDNWWDLKFPDYGPPADQWDNYDLRLGVFVFSPTVVSEPAIFLVLSLGLAAIAGTRARRPTE